MQVAHDVQTFFFLTIVPPSRVFNLEGQSGTCCFHFSPCTFRSIPGCVLLANMANTNTSDCLENLEELVHKPPFKHLPQDKNIPIVLGKYT